MRTQNKDSIPTELVARHVREWVDRYDGGKHDACRRLSIRSGLDESYFAKLHSGTCRYLVSFDSADRMFCAMGTPNLWYCDSELQEYYERVVPEADRLYPVLEFAA